MCYTNKVVLYCIDVPGRHGGHVTANVQPSQTMPSSPIFPSIQYTTSPDSFRHSSLGHSPWEWEGWRPTQHVVVWDNVSFHYSHLVRQWFAAHDRMLVQYLPPYSPFLNPIEEFFTAWRWKFYDWHSHVQMALLAAMDAACDNITAESWRGWSIFLSIFR